METLAANARRRGNLRVLLRQGVKVMFSGLVQSIATIRFLSANIVRVTCLPPNTGVILDDLEIGDSVAVDGTCLTAEKIYADGFTASVSPETVDRVTFGKINSSPQRLATCVNLETSLRVGSKIGGHFVSGHVDGIGELLTVVRTASSWELKFGRSSQWQSAELWEERIGRFLVSKGSIAVNGISLTVADCDRGGTWFTVAVIPHTYDVTNLSRLPVGGWVNLEADLLAKYAARSLASPAAANSPPPIDADFLSLHGY